MIDSIRYYSVTKTRIVLNRKITRSIRRSESIPIDSSIDFPITTIGERADVIVVVTVRRRI